MTAGRAALALFAAGCVSAIGVPTEESLRFAPVATTVDELALGRALYVRKCSGCHHLHLPVERSPDEWQDVLRDMALEADFADHELERIRVYVLTESARARASEVTGPEARRPAEGAAGRRSAP